MKKTDYRYIVEGTKGTLYAKACGTEHDLVDNVAIDSRQAKEGTLFFCIIGERTDAHTYLEDVRSKGCHNVVVSNEEWAARMKDHGDMNVVLVEDTTRALMNLATRYMDDWKDLKKVAVTGSVGKTSTKEFLYSVLKSKFKTGKTPGNLNSEFGIPLTVFGFDEDIEAAVIEVGIGSGPDMAELVRMIKPDIAVITTIGSSHMEFFGSQDKLIDAKLRITSTFKKGNVLVVNNDCRYLSDECIREHSHNEFDIVSVGSKRADYLLSGIDDAGVDGVSSNLEHDGKRTVLKLPVIGSHNLGNAALAVAAGGLLGIDMETAVESLGRTEVNANRLDVRRTDRYVVINDSYNASPESMKAGIDIVMRSNATRRVAILGDMGELGSNAAAMHASVGEYAAEQGMDLIITVGQTSKMIASKFIEESSGQAISFDTRDDAIEALPGILADGDVILVKASRAMGFENITAAITQ